MKIVQRAGSGGEGGVSSSSTSSGKEVLGVDIAEYQELQAIGDATLRVEIYGRCRIPGIYDTWLG